MKNWYSILFLAYASIAAMEKKAIFGEIEYLKNCISAQLELEQGKLLFHSKGSVKEYNEAYELFKKVINQHDNEQARIDAHYYLGCLHYRGLCTSAVMYEAKSHFEIAAEQEIKKDTQAAARYYLGRIYYHASDLGNDRSKAARYFIQASQQEDHEETKMAALSYLAVMHIRGDGVARNLRQAFNCINSILEKNYTTEFNDFFTRLHGPLIRESALDESILHEAAAYGTDLVVKFLIKKGADKGSYDKKGMTPLHYACQNGRVETVKYLCELGAHVQVSDKATRTTPLYLACEHGQAGVVAYLLARGVDKEMKPYKGIAPAHIACKNGHSNVVQLLVDAGAAMESRNAENLTLLAHAFEKGDNELVRYLINKKANLETTCLNGRKLIVDAFEREYFDLVAYLIDHGAKLEGLNKDGLTMVWVAFEKNDLTHLKYLIESGANVEALGKGGDKLIIAAYEKKDRELVKFLIDHHAKIEALDKDGCPLIIKAYLEGDTDFVTYLIEKGASLEVKYRPRPVSQELYKYTAPEKPFLHLVVERDDVDFVDYLLKKGIDKQAVDGQQRTALHVAAQKGRLAMIALLLDAGMSINQRDTSGRTALHYACKVGSLDCVRLLRDKGARLDLSPSCLIDACDGGNLAVVRYLVAQGSNIDIKAVERTVTKGLKEILDYFLGQKAVQDLLRADGDKLFLEAAKNCNEILCAWYVERGCCKELVEEIVAMEEIDSVLDYIKVVIGTPELLKTESDPEKQKEIAGCATALLVKACRLGMCHVVKFLLEVGFDKDGSDFSGATPVMIASYFGQNNVLKLLLEQGAAITARDTFGISALDYTVMQGNVAGILLLLAHAPLGQYAFLRSLVERLKLESVSSMNQLPPLFRLEECRLELARMLLKQESNEQSDVYEMAVPSGGEHSIRLAIHGAVGSLFDRRAGGRTALHLAVLLSSVTLLNDLITAVEAGKVADRSFEQQRKDFFDRQDDEGNTALHIAAYKGNAECVKRLLKVGAKANIKNKFGKTPWMLACLRGHFDVVDTLGSGKYEKDKAGDNAVHQACMRQDLKGLLFLLKNNFGIDEVNKEGNTALYLASFLGNGVIVQELLDRGAQKDKVCGFGFTPLHIACLCGHADVVKRLVKKGANTDIVDKNGMTILAIVRENNDEELVRYLEEVRRQKDHEKFLQERIRQLRALVASDSSKKISADELAGLDAVKDLMHVTYLGELYVKAALRYDKAAACFQKVIDCAKVLKEYKPLPLSWISLGEMHYYGHGMPVDHEKAFEYFLKTAGPINTLSSAEDYKYYYYRDRADDSYMKVFTERASDADAELIAAAYVGKIYCEKILSGKLSARRIGDALGFLVRASGQQTNLRAKELATTFENEHRKALFELLSKEDKK